MLEFINTILSVLRACFTGTATFEWFVVIIVGLMLRTDHLGITSFIFDLSLHPCGYETDLTLAAVDIICLYSYRFKIECTFREMKQVIGAFDYHFWSKSMPKLKWYL
jgi:hypothetical protein